MIDEAGKNSAKVLGLFPIFALVLLLAFEFILNITDSLYNEPLLMFLLHAIFVFSIGILVAAVSARAYLISGSLNILLLGIAALMSSVTLMAAQWALTPSFGSSLNANEAVTMANIGILLSSIFLLLSAVLLWVTLFKVPIAPRKTTLLISYLALFILIVVVVVGSASDLFPLFFVSGTGSTLIREVDLALAFIFLAISSVLFVWKYYRTRSTTLYWYSLGIILFTIGLIGTYSTVRIGDAINWAGRIGFYLMGVYFLIALLSRDPSLSEEASISERWANAFRSDPHMIPTLFANMSAGLAYGKLVTDDHGKPTDVVLLYANQAYEKETGLKASDFVGRRATEAFPALKKDPADWLEPYSRAAINGESLTFERLSPVTKKWYNIIVYSPQKGYFIFLSEDITERKKAEEEIKRNQAILEGINCIFHETIANETNEDLGLVCLDVAEKLTASKFGFIGRLNSLGYLDDDAISNPGWEACSMAEPKGHGRLPVDLKVHGIYGRVIKDGKGFYTNDTKSHPDSIGVPKGHPPLTAFLGVPLKHSGKIIGMIGLGNKEGGYSDKDLKAMEALAPAVVEALQRKKAEEAVALQASLIDLTPDAIIARRVDGTIIFWSEGAEKLYGWTKEEALGQTMNSLLSTEFPDPLEVILARIEQEGQWSGELRHHAKDGREIIVQSRWSVERSGQGDKFDILESNTDITERKRIEENLKRSNEELKQFAYISSHDLQEPLRMVTSYLGLLERRHGDELNGEAKEYMGYAIEGAMRMKGLINDLLSYTRVESRAKPFAEVDMNQVFDEARENLSASIEANRASVESDKLPTVMADDTQMIQLIQNLISNAIKFHGNKEPDVHISYDENWIEWVFAVKDNGIGIAPQYQEKIFDMFQRLHTREEYEGTGIGLAICKKIVERHGGRIWVESEEGKGSTFHFSIPKNPLVLADRNN